LKNGWYCHFFFLNHMSLGTCVLLFLAGLGFELMALCLQGRRYATCAPPPVHFALVILERGGVLQTIAQTGLEPRSFMIAVRIIIMSHWHPA
jgi:hypothetical protein